MTQHARAGYRNHRKATWALALLLVAAVAAAVIPLATGANSKFYTLAVNPTTACSVPTEQTFTLKLTNQTRNQNLGSANITAPSYIALKNGTVEDGTLTISGTTYSSFTVNEPDSFDSTANTIRLRGLNLPTAGSAATITVKALVSVPAPGTDSTWTSIVKQSNTFADSGPGNLFALSGPAPTTTVSACHYAFVQGPTNAVKNAAQTVKVQLQDSSNNPTNVSGSLALSASQNGSPVDSTYFDGLMSSAPDTSGTFKGEQWTFSVTGKISGQGYALTAGTTTSQPTFAIADCIPTDGTCNVGFTGSSDGTSGGAFSGTGLSSSSGITLSFESIPKSGSDICGAPAPTGWNWSPLEYPDPSQADGTGNFDGITLSDFTYTANGSMKLTFYLRNDLFVQTSASQTNDILVCAGARHSSLPVGTPGVPWMGRNGIPAVFDGGPGGTNLYWGVLARISNCNKPLDLNKDGTPDPALCAWGTQTIQGVDYRTATVIFPVDLDLKGVI